MNENSPKDLLCVKNNNIYEHVAPFAKSYIDLV